MCRYNLHSAGSLGWPFPVLKYEYIFQIKYTKQLYQTALGNCYGLKLAKCLLQHCVTNYNFRYTCDLYTSCGEGGGGSLGGANIRSTRRGAEIGLKTEEGKLWQRGVVAQLWGVGLAIRRSRVRSPATARLRNALGKSFTPNCLDADTVR